MSGENAGREKRRTCEPVPRVNRGVFLLNFGRECKLLIGPVDPQLLDAVESDSFRIRDVRAACLDDLLNGQLTFTELRAFIPATRNSAQQRF